MMACVAYLYLCACTLADYVEFNVKVGDLELDLQKYINASFQSITSIDAALALLAKFQDVLQRDSMREDLDSKLSLIFQVCLTTTHEADWKLQQQCYRVCALGCSSTSCCFHAFLGDIDPLTVRVCFCRRMDTSWTWCKLSMKSTS